MKSTIYAILAAMILSGCATRTVWVCPTLPEPVRPTVPLLSPDNLSCLTDDTAERLSGRERRIIEYTEDLETIIATHNRNCRGRNGL